MNEQKMINGVPVDRLFDTIEAVKQNPELGEFHFRAKSRWVNGGHYMSEIKDFYGAGQEDTTRKKPFILHGDEPDNFLEKTRDLIRLNLYSTDLQAALVPPSFTMRPLRI